MHGYGMGAWGYGYPWYGGYGGWGGSGWGGHAASRHVPGTKHWLKHGYGRHLNGSKYAPTIPWVPGMGI